MFASQSGKASEVASDTVDGSNDPGAPVIEPAVAEPARNDITQPEIVLASRQVAKFVPPVPKIVIVGDVTSVENPLCSRRSAKSSQRTPRAAEQPALAIPESVQTSLSVMNDEMLALRSELSQLRSDRVQMVAEIESLRVQLHSAKEVSKQEDVSTTLELQQLRSEVIRSREQYQTLQQQQRASLETIEALKRRAQSLQQELTVSTDALSAQTVFNQGLRGADDLNQRLSEQIRIQTQQLQQLATKLHETVTIPKAQEYIRSLVTSVEEFVVHLFQHVHSSLYAQSARIVAVVPKYQRQLQRVQSIQKEQLRVLHGVVFRADIPAGLSIAELNQQIIEGVLDLQQRRVNQDLRAQSERLVSIEEQQNVQILESELSQLRDLYAQLVRQRHSEAAYRVELENQLRSLEAASQSALLAQQQQQFGVTNATQTDHVIAELNTADIPIEPVPVHAVPPSIGSMLDEADALIDGVSLTRNALSADATAAAAGAVVTDSILNLMGEIDLLNGSGTSLADSVQTQSSRSAELDFDREARAVFLTVQRALSQRIRPGSTMLLLDSQNVTFEEVYEYYVQLSQQQSQYWSELNSYSIESFSPRAKHLRCLLDLINLECSRAFKTMKQFSGE